MPPASRLVLEIDGASRGNPGPAAIGVVIRDARGRVLGEIGEFIGEATNNAAEYLALVRALEEAKALRAGAVVIRSDSELLVSQLEGTYRVKSPELGRLHARAMGLLRGFSGWSAERVPRGRNAAADALANRALDLAVPETTAEFSALVEQHDRGYLARVPALPGVEGRGATRSEALEAARTAASEAIAQLHAAGQPIPKEERIRIRIPPPQRGPAGRTRT